MLQLTSGRGTLDHLIDRLIDFSFDQYMAPRLVKFLYVLSFVAGVLLAAAIGLFGYAALPDLGTAFAAAGVAAGVVLVMIRRIACEIAMRLFGAADLLAGDRVRRHGRRLTTNQLEALGGGR